MDASTPAPLVNGEILTGYVGRKVRAVIQFMRNDGAAVVGRSTDERPLVVKGSPPFQLTAFFEVVGFADSQSSICAESWSNFGDTFDTFAYNRLCQLANGEFQHLFL